ncbi:uncharacterized protein LOC105185856 [Harpegnathos saltator]|uniref:uncharacterized protein LOC105185856 n=1 Tax=Harpegnathos saltator TaxID=610380 RepID=UPI000DBED1FE|nr:uncharacterized protein LOC105185856 [Harpegnathos saltator]
MKRKKKKKKKKEEGGVAEEKIRNVSRVIRFTLNAGDIYCAMCVCLIGCIQDADCSGRTLATLLVAWVATLMVTSILLQWEYMWIVLTFLTILFLLICACMAYNIKKTHMRTWLNEHQRATSETERERERERRPVWTISNGLTTDDCREAESRRIVDLPPSYSSVVFSMQPTSGSLRPSLITGNSPADAKAEDPPPYSSMMAITDTSGRITEAANGPSTESSASATKNNIVSIDISNARDAHD